MTDDDARAELTAAQRLYRGVCEAVAQAPEGSPTALGSAALMPNVQQRIVDLAAIIEEA
jgi:hypothetical protein